LLALHSDGQLLVLRSLTKDFALAGLRLGYAFGAQSVVDRLRAQIPAWNVSGVAQAAGCAALTDRLHLKTTLAQLAQERRAFFEALRQIGCTVIPSRTHFCLLRVGEARRVRQQLLARKLLVRDCTSFGLPQFIRVATRPASEWQQLLQALKEVL
jgi:histidinol-phosphate/aromatic aminotransferase/cobyric acid decarboxylase-like protein